MSTPNLQEELRVLRERYAALHSLPMAAVNNHSAPNMEQLRQKISEISRIWKALPETAELDFHLLDIFRKSINENAVSDILAFLLTPRRGLGELLLPLVASLAGEDFEFSPGTLINREYALRNNRRVDILILDEDHKVFIAIENKVYAKEGNGQTADYVILLREEFPDYQGKFIYLTATGEKPRSNEFVVVSYADLITRVKSLSVGSILKAHPRKVFLFNDFLEHMEENFMGSKDIANFSEKTRLYLENFEMLNDLQTTYKQETGDIFDLLIQKLALGSDWETRQRSGWWQIWKKNWEAKNIFVHFELHNPESMIADKSFAFMVDVEGGKKESFFSKYEQMFPRLSSEYKTQNIKYRPKERSSVALAYKRYPLSQSKPEVVAALKQAFTDFQFIVPQIDDIMAQIK